MLRSKIARRLGLTALAGVVLGGAVLVGTWDAGHRKRDTNVARAAEAEVSTPLPGPGQREASRLAPVVDSRATTATELALAAPGAPSSHTTLPAAGSYRLIGRALDDDGQVLACEAVVKVYLESMTNRPDEVLGEVPVGAGGYFALDLPRLAELGGLTRQYAELRVRLLAPGYEPDEHGVDVVDAKNGLMRADFHVDREGVLLHGRVVDSEFAPVAGATLTYATWNVRNPDSVNVDSLRTDADGAFAARIWNAGWVDALAVHAAVGVGKVGRRVERDALGVDLGDVVLEPRGVIAGTMVGPDGDPVPNQYVEVEPTNDVDGIPSQSTDTDARGRFRFANLESMAYTVRHEYSDEYGDDGLVVSPGTTNLVLRMPYPSITVRVLDESGEPAPVGGISCRALARADDGTWRPASTNTDEHELDVGVHLVVFHEPGRYAISASDWIEDERWSATRIFDVGREQRDVELRLERDDVVPVTLEIVDSSGEPITSWRASVRDAQTGIRVAQCTSRRATQRLMPGRWDVRVTPGAPSLAFPFDATIVVEEPAIGSTSQQAIELRAEDSGARLTVGLIPTDTHGGKVSVRLWTAEGKSIRGSGSGNLARSEIAHPTLLGPGEYDLIVRRAEKKGVPFGEVRRRITIEAGEHKRVSIAFPGS